MARPNRTLAPDRTTYTAAAIRSDGPAIASECRGGRNRNAARTPPRAAASTDGPNPQYHATPSTAKKTIANGNMSPTRGSSAARAALARTAAATAIP